MLYFAANQWRSVTGGENGLQDIPRTLAGLDLSNGFFYYAALPVILVGLAVAWRTVHSPFGRVIVAIRENAPRARALGYPANQYKLVVFVVSGFLSGLAGGVYAVNHGFASLQEVYWTTSGTVVVMTVLGGIGTLWGSLVGAALIVRLQDWLSTSGFDEVGLVTGAIFIVVVLLFRRGIWGTVAHVVRQRSAHPTAEGTGQVQDSDPDPDREQELRSIG
jgi:branched-chain amino acid transport system permease protein